MIRGFFWRAREWVLSRLDGISFNCAVIGSESRRRMEDEGFVRLMTGAASRRMRRDDRASVTIVPQQDLFQPLVLIMEKRASKEFIVEQIEWGKEKILTQAVPAYLCKYILGLEAPRLEAGTSLTLMVRRRRRGELLRSERRIDFSRGEATN